MFFISCSLMLLKSVADASVISFMVSLRFITVGSKEYYP